MSTLADEIAVYENMQASLEREHLGEWVVIHEGEVRGFYESSHDAIEDSLTLLAEGRTCLIREVGRPRVVEAPTSIAYRMP